MRKIKLFLEFVAGDSVKASKFVPQMTIEQLAKMFEQSPEYILEFETYLAMLVENGKGVIGKKNALEDYKFNLEENFPTYLDGDGGSGL